MVAVALALGVSEAFPLPECEPDGMAESVEVPTKVTVCVPLRLSDAEPEPEGAVAEVTLVPEVVVDCAATSDASSTAGSVKASMARLKSQRAE